MVEQLHDLKRIASGHMEYAITRVPLDQALGDAAALVDSHLEQLGLRFEHEMPAAGATVLADPGKLQQILLNLLSNAAKFTPTGGTVTLACEPGPQGDVHIHVRDSGIGIPADQLDAVFEPFVQVRDLRKPSAAGTGLGLAISRDLARGMGGELTARSTSGRGSTFTVALPRG
jgi:signal transduction histidine kinase